MADCVAAGGSFLPQATPLQHQPSTFCHLLCVGEMDLQAFHIPLRLFLFICELG